MKLNGSIQNTGELLHVNRQGLPNAIYILRLYSGLVNIQLENGQNCKYNRIINITFETIEFMKTSL